MLFRSMQHQANHRRTPAPQYTSGQRVWLRAKDLPLQVESRKLSPHFMGLFEIESLVNSCAVRLKLPATLCVHPVFHVSQIKPVSLNPLCSRRPWLRYPPPPPARGFQYLVDWDGYGPEERYWVPRSRILDPSLIWDFNRGRQAASGRASGGARGRGVTIHLQSGIQI